MQHLALAVHDEGRSRRFYERYFGFGAGGAQRYPDGTLIVRNASGFSLALGVTDEEITLPSFFHFGFDAAGPEEVWGLRDRLVADGVELVGEWDEEDYVSIKFRDPDGYVVELAWEIPRPSED
jgi:catechol 2,3-dioxygenase-like lactoylglutathione lyase family enzyme